ncbi:MAG TPA: DUF3014 domain-containing protein [Spongiibacteraceae bacterium]
MQKQRRYTETLNTSWWGWVVLIACMLVFLAWYLRESPQPTTSTSILPMTSVQPQPILRNDPNAQAASEEKLKPLAATPRTLADSDGDVIVAANDLAPQLVQWLTPSEQIRKWVALVDQIADSKIPQNNRPLDYPVTLFEVERHKDKLLPNTANYQRASWLIGVLADISAIRLAHYYHEWRPAFEKAHKELGIHNSFDKQLHKAIQNVLEVKPLITEPELIQSGVYYQYADPNLESAGHVEKLLWRMGSENTRKLQHFLRELEPLL